MKPRYVMFAAYNRWANECVYTAAAALSDADYRRDCAAFFCSVHGTLNHMLVADRVWMRRFTGEGVAPAALDTILHDDFAPLRADRIKEDERIVRWIDSLDDARLASDFDYIIFDMPSVNQISITPRLAGFMDLVLLVVESERTDRDLVQRATRLLSETRAHVGVVLNKTRQYVPRRLHEESLAC